MFWHHRELKEIPGMRWNKSDAQIFDVDFNSVKELDAKLLIRYVYGYSDDFINCQVRIEKDGELVSEEAVSIQVRDEQGEYLGEGSVDLWDIQQRFLSSYSFEPGTYRFTVTHTMPVQELPLIMEVGLKLVDPEG